MDEQVIKKKVMTDLANSRNFIVVAFLEKEVKTHTMITGVSEAFISIREIEKIRQNLLFPPQSSVPAIV